jgi:hypothetical protein
MSVYEKGLKHSEILVATILAGLVANGSHDSLTAQSVVKLAVELSQSVVGQVKDNVFAEGNL